MNDAQVFRRCPICQSVASSAFKEKGKLKLVSCQECGMVYANPVEGSLASGQFYDQTEAAYYLSKEKVEADYDPVRFQREIKIVQRYCSGGRLLDVGCSTGAFCHALKAATADRFEMAGTDVTDQALDYAESKGLEVWRGRFPELRLEEGWFDLVTFWAVLEHVIEPAQFLKKAALVLKPGGLCFVLTPNLRSLAVRLLGMKYRYFLPDHVNYFSTGTLKSLAERTPGFTVIEIMSSHFNPIVVAQDFFSNLERVEDVDRGRLLRRTNAMKRNKLYAPARWVYGLVDQLLSKVFLGDNLILVLRKVGSTTPVA